LGCIGAQSYAIKRKGNILERYLKKYTIKLSELCFYLFFCTLLFAKGIGLYDGQTSFKLFFLIALIGWAGKMLLERYLVREILVYGTLLALGGVIYLVSHEKGAFIAILLICGAKNIDIKRIFKVGAITWMISYGSLFLLTSLHIIDSGFKVHDRFGMGRVIRWNLGYAHPNVLHISYFVLVCFLVYLFQKKLSNLCLVLLELGNLYVFMFSLSTTGFLVTTICLGLVFYWNIRKGFCRAEQILIQLCLPVCLFLSFGAPLLLKGNTFNILNKILNTRLELSKWFLQNQPVKLLGVDTTTIVTSLRTMDNSYVFALITYGVLFFILVTVCYFRIILRKTIQQDGIALCIILSCLIAGITEPFLFNTSFKNISLLFIGTEFFAAEKASGKKSIGLKLDRDIEVKLPYIPGIWDRLKGCSRRYRKGLVVISTVGAVLAGVIVYQNESDPERYLLPRKAFEYTDDIEESYYLESEDDIRQPGDKIMGFESEQTEMVPFKGNIARLERFRNVTARGSAAGMLIFIAGNFVLLYKTRMKNGKSFDER
jgi:hypothetical protein